MDIVVVYALQLTKKTNKMISIFVSGLPPEKREFFKNAKTEITYSQDGEEWVIVVGMQGVPQSRTFRFKLGEPYESASLDGSPLKVSHHVIICQ